MRWTAKNFNWNTKQLISIDVLYSRLEKIKKWKKSCSTIEEFAVLLRADLMGQYWSRCEYEMLLYKEDGRIYVKPWIGNDTREYAVDLTKDETFDWQGFAEKQLTTTQRPQASSRHEMKIDVFDQILYRWTDLVNYVWGTRLPYERKQEKFNQRLG